ncbi:CAP domain-containing protein [Psychromarinibacter halotolerans]|uniref:CAP domain-containing protein n=1 Tax=Psychromarinibacter halotolerans TaxID=1775175 RepID=A0ABV7GJA0_9RHOB|nr:CAP domain-containing protein [Psychromarinibacter halotolerans]MDF0595894.1 CAP domain-containing protein [Psychromarinibacter halotolerans]
MIRPILSLLTCVVLLAACGGPAIQTNANGERIYSLSNGNQGPVQLRMLDSVNALRSANGLRPLQLDSSLNAAALTHSRDMSRQGRPWHFGADGSSPVERVVDAGYTKRMLGENISETYETETETLAAWMQDPLTRGTVMAPEGEDMGFAFQQDANGKIWYTLVVGGGPVLSVLSPAPRANTAPPAPAPTVPVPTTETPGV